MNCPITLWDHAGSCASTVACFNAGSRESYLVPLFALSFTSSPGAEQGPREENCTVRCWIPTESLGKFRLSQLMTSGEVIMTYDWLWLRILFLRMLMHCLQWYVNALCLLGLCLTIFCSHSCETLSAGNPTHEHNLCLKKKIFILQIKLPPKRLSE